MSKQWTNKGWDVFIPGGGFSLRNCPDPVDNATRIVECVNACSGMSDPCQDIAMLKRQRDELLTALADMVFFSRHTKTNATVLNHAMSLIAEIKRDATPLERTGQ